MSTSTILRVKRRLEDNPQDALVLLCKRAKTEDSDVSPSLFVFRGTVNNEETSQVKSVLPKSDIKLQSTHNVNDIIDKIRKERKDASTDSRYEVVNCHRGLKEADEDQFDLVDLARKDQQENEQYAYDLYTAAKQDFDISMLDHLVSIENYETDLIFGTHRDNGRRTPSSDGNDDDDDSNDENNWRNDYPDEEEGSIGEEDMVRAVEKIGLEDDLSSDEGEDRIYDQPADIDKEDVLRYGAAYAEYKARVMGTPGKEGFVHCSVAQDVDGESAQGYKDDSDDGFYYGQEQDSRQFREQYDSNDDPD